MADRYPLIANSQTNRIEELASGDNLSLQGNSIVGATTITAQKFIGNLDGTAGLSSSLLDGSNILSGTISSQRLSGYYPIEVLHARTADADGIINGTIPRNVLSGPYDINVTGVAQTANYLQNAANINGGIISADRLAGTYNINITGTAFQIETVENISVASTDLNANYYIPFFNSIGDSGNLYKDPTYLTYNPGLNRLGIGTTTPRYSVEIGSVGQIGTSLWVNGDSRITGILTVGTSSIVLNGITNQVNVGSGVTIEGDTGILRAKSLNINGQNIIGAGVTLITAGSGISVNQNTGNVTISAIGSAVTSITAGSGISINQSTGNVTITATGGSGGTSSQWVTVAAGIHTTSNVGIGTTNPRGNLQIGTGVTIFGNTGIISATKYYGDGSTLTGINVGAGISVIISDTPPSSPTSGNLWYDSSLGRGFIYYIDADSSQWVDFSPSGAGISNSGGSSGIIIRDDSTILGTATTISFGTGLGVTFNNGVATVNVSGDGDQYYNNVSLLLHMDGTNGSTNFTDSSRNLRIINNVGNAQISTSQSKFGGASGYFDGSGDYLTTTLDAFGTNDFTIEAWVRISTTLGLLTIYESRIADGDTSGFIFGISSGTLSVYINGWVLQSGTVSTNSWTHVALTRSSGVWRTFVNGVMQAGTYTNAGNFTRTAVRVGMDWNTLYGMNGYLDDFRITNGIARYTSNFTLPTVPFENQESFIFGGGTSSQWVTAAAGIHTTSNVGIGTTNPTAKLYVSGGAIITGVTTSQNGFVGTLTGTATTATNLANAANITTGTIDDARLPDLITSNINITSGVSTFSTAKATIFEGNLTGTATTATNLANAANITTGTIDDARLPDLITSNINITSGISTFSTVKATTFEGSLTGTATTSGVSTNVIGGIGSITQLQVSGISTFTNGPILVGTTTSTGITTQRLQVTGGAYVSGNLGIGTTNPQGTLQVGTGITMQSSTGIISATQFSGNSLRFSTNNVTIVGTSGTLGEVKQIGGVPFFYDGSAWREFVLSSGTPVSVPADTDWDTVILRSTFDDSLDDLRFNVTPTKSGTAVSIVGSPVKIGTNSLRLNGEYLFYPARSEYNFSGQWTIEGWFYFDTLPPTNSYMGIFSQEYVFGLSVYKESSTAVNFIWNNVNNSTTSMLLSVNPSSLLNTWNHIAIVRSASTGIIDFYFNGSKSSSTPYIENNIASVNNSLYLGYNSASNYMLDAFVDDFRISKVARYSANFTPSTTAYPITGTLSSYVKPPGDKYGTITLGAIPTWRGTSGVTVTQQSSGVYRLTYTSVYSNSSDYFVLANVMDFSPVAGTLVHISRNTSYTDFTITRASDGTLINSGSLAVQIINHT